MNIETIDSATSEWNDMTSVILESEPLSLPDMQGLLLKTYLILYMYHQVDYVPKAISKMISAMDEFLYFSVNLEAHDVGIDDNSFHRISCIIFYLKNGFFKGEYKYPFPKLEISDITGDKFVIDFEKDVFAECMNDF